MKTRLAEKDITRGQTPNRIKPSLKSGEGVKMEKTITIDRSPEEIYAFWRRFENLPRFMQHLESVTEAGGGTSHWVLKTGHGKMLEWDARLIEDKPGQMISWQSLEGADVDNAGSVWFTAAPGAGSTEVKVAMKYSPPGGKLGLAMAKFFGENPDEEMAEDLGRLKALLEAGGMRSG